MFSVASRETMLKLGPEISGRMSSVDDIIDFFRKMAANGVSLQLALC